MDCPMYIVFGNSWGHKAQTWSLSRYVRFHDRKPPSTCKRHCRVKQWYENRTMSSAYKRSIVKRCSRCCLLTSPSAMKVQERTSLKASIQNPSRVGEIVRHPYLTPMEVDMTSYKGATAAMYSWGTQNCFILSHNPFERDPMLPIQQAHKHAITWWGLIKCPQCEIRLYHPSFSGKAQVLPMVNY